MSSELANSAQARKRARQAEQARLRNASARSRLRTYVKGVIRTLRDGDASAAADAYRSAVPVIDGAVSKGLIHKNKAARHKSRLNTRVRALQSA